MGRAADGPRGQDGLHAAGRHKAGLPNQRGRYTSGQAAASLGRPLSATRGMNWERQFWVMGYQERRDAGKKQSQLAVLSTR